MANGLYPQLPTNSQTTVAYTHSNQENPSLTITQTDTANENYGNVKAQFQKRLEDHYPIKLVINYSLLLMLTNLIIIALQMFFSSSLNSPNKKDYWYTKRTIAYTAFSNILYAILGLISARKKSYMIIQILAILYFIASVASMFFFVIVDFILYIAELILGNCGLICSVIQFGKIIFGTLSGVIAFFLFLKIQVRFLKQLNDNTFG